jgi:hypothetical protein
MGLMVILTIVDLLPSCGLGLVLLKILLIVML